MDVVGHKKILDFLRAAKDAGRLAHGYLFCGPAGVGKFMVAKKMAAELLGVDENRFLNHPDVTVLEREIDAKTKKLAKNLSIDQIRGTIHRLNLSSFLDSWKIAIINDAETLSLPAANALLKTLEEPRDKVMIILISQSREALPATIFSRLQVINFTLVSDSEILSGLLNRGMTRETAAEISRLALGRPGRAIEFLAEPEKITEYKERAEWFIKLLKNNLAARFKMVEEYAGEFGKEEAVSEALGVLDIWNGVLRDIASSALGNREAIAHRFLEEKFSAVSRDFGGKILLLKDGLDEARQMISANVNYELAFKNIFLKI
ncbi:MAG: AAA family ATPase [Patescibacteria group bacterium]